jgi:RNA polymerase sigma-70 factor (ECF subfamily)
LSKIHSFAMFNTYEYARMSQINFNSIYTTYYRKAFLFTLSYVHNDQVAEDIVSEAIIHLWELSKERDISSVEAILITYIRSKSLNYLKHLQAQENVFQKLVDKGQRELEIRISTLEACDPKEILSEELRAKVHSLLANMPEKTRFAFIRDRLDGKSHKEIAEELGISVKGVEYHISKAVRILRDNLKDYAPFLLFLI